MSVPEWTPLFSLRFKASFHVCEKWLNMSGFIKQSLAFLAGPLKPYLANTLPSPSKCSSANTAVGRHTEPELPLNSLRLFKLS